MDILLCFDSCFSEKLGTYNFNAKFLMYHIVANLFLEYNPTISQNGKFILILTVYIFLL